MNREVELEKELESAAAALHHALEIGKVKSIGLREVAHGVRELIKERDTERARAEAAERRAAGLAVVLRDTLDGIADAQRQGSVGALLPETANRFRAADAALRDPASALAADVAQNEGWCCHCGRVTVLAGKHLCSNCTACPRAGDARAVCSCGGLRSAVEEARFTGTAGGRTMVKAKFRCTSKREVCPATTCDDAIVQVEFEAVYGDGTGNEQWSKWTPSGQLAMSITNEPAHRQFEVGKDYFLTLEAAE